jgi:hypothetical protein
MRDKIWEEGTFMALEITQGLSKNIACDLGLSTCEILSSLASTILFLLSLLCYLASLYSQSMTQKLYLPHFCRGLHQKLWKAK